MFSEALTIEQVVFTIEHLNWLEDSFKGLLQSESEGNQLGDVFLSSQDHFN